MDKSTIIGFKYKRLICPLVIVFVIGASFGYCAEKYTEMRQRMVNDQLLARGINDQRVIYSMLKVERHRFVSEGIKDIAYVDKPLPIGSNQTISQPYMVGLMTQLLSLRGGERVLEVGTGSGYQAAVLAEIAGEVYTVEIIPELAVSAGKRFQELGYKNVFVRCGDGYYGWADKGPFDAIIVSCGVTNIPPDLVNQLREGGRMVIPVGTDPQKLLFVWKEKGEIKTKFITDVRFVPLTGGHGVEKK